MSAYLSLSGIGKDFGKTSALSAIDLDVEQGEFLALLGPSGCGKTTLLRILAGLETATRGKIVLAGQEITSAAPWARDIGLVFQSYALFPHMTVRQNVAFGLEMRGLRGREAEAHIDEALDIVSMRDYANRRPAQMSGGQQQRIAIARAIAIKPRLLLLDEPLSNLDAVLRQSVRMELRELHDRTGLTTIMVTHDQAEALTIADRVALMARGKVEQLGTPKDIYEYPSSAFAAGFIGAPAANLMPALYGAEGFTIAGQLWQPEMPIPLQAKAVTLALRPEALELTAPQSPHSITGKVKAVEYMGAEHLIHMAVEDKILIARQQGKPPMTGEVIGLRPRQIAGIYDQTTGARLGPQKEE